MPRPSQLDDRRRELLPVVAKAFSELGYRRATTAKLAERCDVRETILYRLWDDKRAMFLAAIDFLYERRMAKFRKDLRKPRGNGSDMERVIDYVAELLGKDGLYRIIFAGLAENDDPEIQSALKRMYKNYQRVIEEHIADHRADSSRSGIPADADSAWAIIGLVTVMNVLRQLNLEPLTRRKEMFKELSRFLVNGQRE
jgi:AcrR family transcriptional regulator